MESIAASYLCSFDVLYIMGKILKAEENISSKKFLNNFVETQGKRKKKITLRKPITDVTEFDHDPSECFIRRMSSIRTPFSRIYPLNLCDVNDASVKVDSSVTENSHIKSLCNFKGNFPLKESTQEIYGTRISDDFNDNTDCIENTQEIDADKSEQQISCDVVNSKGDDVVLVSKNSECSDRENCAVITKQSWNLLETKRPQKYSNLKGSIFPLCTEPSLHNCSDLDLLVGNVVRNTLVNTVVSGNSIFREDNSLLTKTDTGKSSLSGVSYEIEDKEMLPVTSSLLTITAIPDSEYKDPLGSSLKSKPQIESSSCKTFMPTSKARLLMSSNENLWPLTTDTNDQETSVRPPDDDMILKCSSESATNGKKSKLSLSLSKNKKVVSSTVKQSGEKPSSDMKSTEKFPEEASQNKETLRGKLAVKTKVSPSKQSVKVSPVTSIKKLSSVTPSAKRLSQVTSSTKKVVPITPSAEKLSPGTSSAKKVVSAKKLSPVTPSAEKLAPVIPSAKKVVPAKILSPITPSRKKLSPVTRSVKRLSQVTSSAKKVVPVTPSAEKLSPVTPSAEKLSSGTPLAKKLSPVTPSVEKLSPDTPSAKKVVSAQKLSPVTPSSKKVVTAKKLSPITPSAKKLSPVTPSGKRQSQVTSSAKKLSPVTPSVEKLSPGTPSAKKVVSAQKLSPVTPSAKKVVTAKKLSPFMPSAKKLSPVTPSVKRQSQVTSSAKKVPVTPSAEKLSPGTPSTKKVVSAQKLSPVTPSAKKVVSAKKVSPITPSAKKLSPGTPSVKRQSQVTSSAKKVVLVTPSAEKLSPGTPSAKKVVSAKKLSPVTPSAEKLSSGTPSAKKLCPVTPSAEKLSPDTSSAKKLSPVTPSAKKVVPAKKLSLITPSAKKLSPVTPSANKLSPVTPSVKKLSPITPSAKKLSLVIPSAKKLSSFTPSAKKEVPAKKLSPAPPSAKKVVPTTLSVKMLSSVTPSAQKVVSPVTPSIKKLSPVSMSVKKVVPIAEASKKVPAKTRPKSKLSRTLRQHIMKVSPVISVPNHNVSHGTPSDTTNVSLVHPIEKGSQKTSSHNVASVIVSDKRVLKANSENMQVSPIKYSKDEASRVNGRSVKNVLPTKFLSLNMSEAPLPSNEYTSVVEATVTEMPSAPCKEHMKWRGTAPSSLVPVDGRGTLKSIVDKPQANLFVGNNKISPPALKSDLSLPSEYPMAFPMVTVHKDALVFLPTELKLNLENAQRHCTAHSQTIPEANATCRSLNYCNIFGAVEYKFKSAECCWRNEKRNEEKKKVLDKLSSCRCVVPVPDCSSAIPVVNEEEPTSGSTELVSNAPKELKHSGINDVPVPDCSSAIPVVNGEEPTSGSTELESNAPKELRHSGITDDKHSQRYRENITSRCKDRFIENDHPQQSKVEKESVVQNTDCFSGREEHDKDKVCKEKKKVDALSLVNHLPLLTKALMNGRCGDNLYQPDENIPAGVNQSVSCRNLFSDSSNCSSQECVLSIAERTKLRRMGCESELSKGINTQGLAVLQSEESNSRNDLTLTKDGLKYERGDLAHQIVEPGIFTESLHIAAMYPYDELHAILPPTDFGTHQLNTFKHTTDATQDIAGALIKKLQIEEFLYSTPNQKLGTDIALKNKKPKPDMNTDQKYKTDIALENKKPKADMNIDQKTETDIALENKKPNVDVTTNQKHETDIALENKEQKSTNQQYETDIAVENKKPKADMITSLSCEERSCFQMQQQKRMQTVDGLISSSTQPPCQSLLSKSYTDLEAMCGSCSDQTPTNTILASTSNYKTRKRLISNDADFEELERSNIIDPSNKRNKTVKNVNKERIKMVEKNCKESKVPLTEKFTKIYLGNNFCDSEIQPVSQPVVMKGHIKHRKRRKKDESRTPIEELELEGKETTGRLENIQEGKSKNTHNEKRAKYENDGRKGNTISKSKRESLETENISGFSSKEKIKRRDRRDTEGDDDRKEEECMEIMSNNEIRSKENLAPVENEVKYEGFGMRVQWMLSTTVHPKKVDNTSYHSGALVKRSRCTKCYGSTFVKKIYQIKRDSLVRNNTVKLSVNVKKYKMLRNCI